MKNLFAILLFFCLHTQAQTAKPIKIYDPLKEGPYKEYYKSGKLKVEGYYQKVDSIECINCYEFVSAFYPTDTSKMVKTNWVRSHLMRTGIWKQYYENGQLKAQGSYKGVHGLITSTVAKPVPHPQGYGVFQPGDYKEEFVKDKLWQYYNTKGQLIKEEEYYYGVVIKEIIYEH